MFLFNSWLIPVLSIVALIIGSVTDFKKREVPDFLNFSLIAAGLSLGLITSLINWSPWPVLASISGFIVAYLFSALMYYTGQWGGGDAKMLMGLGALQGVVFFGPNSFISTSQIPIFFTLIITIFFAGSIYSIFYLFALIIINWKKFKSSLIKKLEEKYFIKLKWLIFSVTILSLLLAFFLKDSSLKLIFIMVALMSFVGFFISIFVKIVEKNIMISSVLVKNLVPGDWVSKDVVVNGKVIYSHKTTGLEDKHIAKLKKFHVKKVFVKDGIPFIPGFLIGYLIVFFLGNWLSVLINYFF